MTVISGPEEDSMDIVEDTSEGGEGSDNSNDFETD